MKLSIATSTGVFLAMSTKDALAFAPSNLPAPVASSTNTASGPTSLALFASNNANNVEESNNNFDFLPKINGNAAASFLMASLLAVSTVATVDAAVFVQPAHAEKIVVEQAKPDAKKQKKAPKKEAPKISAEEKDLKKSKANLDLSKQTLKAYEKLTSDAKSANSKASSALETATKNAASAKKEYSTISDKFSSAKSQKMPQSAIKELSADAGTKKNEREREQHHRKSLFCVLL
jgi:outer membrane biosynthesis protein TonB